RGLPAIPEPATNLRNILELPTNKTLLYLSTMLRGGMLSVENSEDWSGEMAFYTPSDLWVVLCFARRFSTYRSVSGSWAILEIVTIGNAALRDRSPPRLSRCLTVLPDEAVTGLTPARGKRCLIPHITTIRPYGETFGGMDGSEPLFL